MAPRRGDSAEMALMQLVDPAVATPAPAAPEDKKRGKRKAQADRPAKAAAKSAAKEAAPKTPKKAAKKTKKAASA
jgi:hypothetical protein